jgi:CubicO group peptidase (beta-lactamase class C family)
MIQQRSSKARFLNFYKHTNYLYIGLCALFTLACVSPSASQDSGPWPTETWKEVNPEAVGMSSATLKEAEDVYPRVFPSSYSFLVIRNGQLVSESYFHGQTAESTNHIYSVTKTFVAVLLGIAVQQEWITGVDQRVADLLPDYPMHPKLEALTLEDILTHRSGVRNDKSFSDIGLLLKGEPQSIPNTTFEYSNYAPNLLTSILDRQAKQGVEAGVSDLTDLAQKHLFGPLGISVSEWRKLPSGVPEGGNGIHMTSRDMARLGYLLLRDGRWEDKQLLAPGWVEAASKLHAEFDRQKGYGYLNWVRRRPDIVKTEQGEIEVQGYFAYGHRGQLIAMYPALDLLVVTTADATDSTRDTFFVPDLQHDFIRRFVFSAITK